jgi:hypothetical protein
MPKSLHGITTLVVLLTSQGAMAQNLVGDVKACRLLADTAQRLTCYDAMQLPAEAPKPSPSAAAATAPVAAVPGPAPADPVARVGQESVKQPASAAPELKQIESRIRGAFRGWGPGTQLELENGQVWRIADGSSAIYALQDPKVIVHRGILGAFYLEIEGVGFQMRVVRVR